MTCDWWPISTGGPVVILREHAIITTTSKASIWVWMIIIKFSSIFPSTLSYSSLMNYVPLVKFEVFAHYDVSFLPSGLSINFASNLRASNRKCLILEIVHGYTCVKMKVHKDCDQALRLQIFVNNVDTQPPPSMHVHLCSRQANSGGN